MKGQKGFTLVELMVVVTIIGILAAVGFPTFKSYQAKARASEAKASLSAMYMGFMAFASENNDSYLSGTTVPTLAQIGYENNAAKRLFAVGYGTTTATCVDANSGIGKSISECGSLTGHVEPTATTFTIAANGFISSKNVDSNSPCIITMDHNKTVSDAQCAY